MRARLWSVLAAGACAPLVAACGGTPSTTNSSNSVPANAGAVVEMKSLSFNPPTVSIKAGQRVVWRFDDSSIVHNVVGEGFHSPDQSSGTFSHTFAQAGEYRYLCTIHAGMNGDVIVQ